VDRGGNRVRMMVRAFRARLRLLRRKRERGRDRMQREEKRRYKERGNRTRRAGALRGGEEGRKAAQHYKRQRCTLPGGRSDNVYRGPPAIMPIFRVETEGEGYLIQKETRKERSRSESSYHLLVRRLNKQTQLDL